MSKSTRKAFRLGIRDGWEQPHDLSTSINVEHLDDGQGDVYNALDRGINVGQFLHAGIRSQAWVEGFWPFAWNGHASH